MVISEPEDYGLSAEQTLAHRADRDRPEHFDDFWRDFREACAALPDRWRGRIDDRINEVVIESVRAIRVVARLTMPEDSSTPRAVIVTTHGYGAEASFPGLPELGDALGLATLRLRARGFPPSTVDMPDLRGEWILNHIESPDAWIVRGAVGDLVQAIRCARAHFGERVPIMLHGESFGGGLAVLAAAQLRHMDIDIPRIAIGLPTFGDWRWRDGRYCNGAGGLVNDWLDRMREDRPAYVENLRLFDAALHAADVLATVLCKLALRDDVVPAPTAAAVYHALPDERDCRKRRFVVRYGHYDGGLADTRRHVLFERLWPMFVDPDRDPEAVLAACDGPLEIS